MAKNEQIVSYDIKEIQARLPHRYPFLMIDKIEESGSDYAIAIKNVSINEPYFIGHFPGNPIMPAALITESCLQASAFIGLADKKEPTPNMRFFCTGFNMKFTDSAHPGDQLRIDVRLVKRLGQMLRVKTHVSKAKNQPVASGDLSLAYEMQ